MARRRKRSPVPLPYEVTGPGYERAFPSEGSAIARALDLTLDTGATHYVRDAFGKIIAYAEGEQHRFATIVKEAT